jgi:parvulin-like peptidyl-prolyl isomerase
LKKLLSSPLLHFVLIGTFLFLLYDRVKPAGGGRDTITIDDDMVNRSIAIFQKEWGRPPSNEELQGLVDRQIHQEVFYRQALKMNLDHNDELVRRRMEQKLAFITNDLATMSVPPDDSLKAFMSRSGDRYKVQDRISFVHIYFNPDRRREARKDALSLLARLSASHDRPEDHIRDGDGFPFLQQVVDMSRKEVSSQMGDAFADSLMSAPVGKWYGPVLSGFGTHLVYVVNHKPPAEPDFAAVRADLLRDYQYEASQFLNEKVYRDFRKQYKVHFMLKDSALQRSGMDKKLGDRE